MNKINAFKSVNYKITLNYIKYIFNYDLMKTQYFSITTRTHKKMGDF